MVRVFLAAAPNPQLAFACLNTWAAASGYQLTGDSKEGVIHGDPSGRARLGLARLFYPAISCEYTVQGADVTIVTERDVPTSFESELRKAGFLDVRSTTVV